jgi:hypothetical protein
MRYKIIYGYYADQQEDIIDAASNEEVVQLIEDKNRDLCDELMWSFIDMQDYEEADEFEQEDMELAGHAEAMGQCESMWVRLDESV